MTLRELEKAYRVLGARKRLEALKLLSDGRERSVGEVASRIHLSFTATSKHLVLLRQAGLLERRQAGYVGLYSLEQNLSPTLDRLLQQVRRAS